MILIADAGSTTTDWRFVDEEYKIYPFVTQGINPYFQSKGTIADLIKSELMNNKVSINPEALLDIHFYGAGCASVENSREVATALKINYGHM